MLFRKKKTPLPQPKASQIIKKKKKEEEREEKKGGGLYALVIVDWGTYKEVRTFPLMKVSLKYEKGTKTITRKEWIIPIAEDFDPSKIDEYERDLDYVVVPPPTYFASIEGNKYAFYIANMKKDMIIPIERIETEDEKLRFVPSYQRALSFIVNHVLVWEDKFRKELQRENKLEKWAPLIASIVMIILCIVIVVLFNQGLEKIVTKFGEGMTKVVEKLDVIVSKASGIQPPKY